MDKNGLTNKYAIGSIRRLLENRLFNNMSWLFILNFSNTIIPFLTFPYITRVFHPEGYGQISFALSFVSYFQSFIDYGFNLTGARKIATIEENKQELSKVYSVIIFTKLFFFSLSIPIIIFCTLSINQLYNCRILIYIFIAMMLGNVLLPIWLFQGMQRVKDMVKISLLVRMIFVICIFIFIKSPSDMLLYTVIYSVSFLIIGLLSMFIIRFQLKIAFGRISIREIKGAIIDGFYVFTSSAIISILGTTEIFVLGLFHTSTETGYYSGLSKISQVTTMMFYPIGQALFPYHSKKYNESFDSGYNSTIRFAKIIIPIFLFIALIIIFLRRTIILSVLGTEYLIAKDLLFIVAFLPVLSIISNFLGTQILVGSGKTKEYGRAFIKGAMVSIVLYIILGYYFAMWGVAIAALLGAVVNLLFLYYEILPFRK